MFSMHDFIKDGFLKAVGNQPDYWIILNAAGYAEKGVLTEGDLADIQAAIDRKNQPVQSAQAVTDTTENPVEETDQGGEVEAEEQTEENPNASENTTTETEEEIDDDY